jgi:hypothetical protein
VRSTCLYVSFAIGLSAAVVAELAGADIKISTNHDRKADFTALRSYEWLPTPPYTSQIAPSARDERLEREALDEPIRAAVDAVLASKGFTVAESGAQPDFLVVYYAAFGIGMNEELLGAHYEYLTGWGSPFAGATATQSLHIIEQGTLVIDILRRDRSVAIWRGTATGAVDRTRTQEQRLRTIAEAVKKVFARFPPKR